MNPPKKKSQTQFIKTSTFKSVSKGDKALSFSATFWFLTAFIGQLIFVLYIIGLYGFSLVQGDFNKWNSMMPHGYVEGDITGNISIGIHLLLAAVISLGGPLQIIPQIRGKFPVFHRWLGRTYVSIAIIISLTGFYLTWIRGSVAGSLPMDIAITINGTLIILFAILAIHHARAHRFAVHRKWALRLFMVVSGVWFFRVFLMLWLLIHQKPVGFDPVTFQGPFLTFLSYGQYLLPLFFLEIYFLAQERAGQTGKFGAAALIGMLAIATAAGIFGATMGMWLPRMF